MNPPYDTEDARTLQTHPIRIPFWERAMEAIGRFLKEHGIAAFMAVALLVILAVLLSALFKAWERQADRQAALEERQVKAIERMAIESLPSGAVTTIGRFTTAPTPRIATCG